MVQGIPMWYPRRSTDVVLEAMWLRRMPMWHPPVYAVNLLMILNVQLSVFMKASTCRDVNPPTCMAL